MLIWQNIEHIVEIKDENIKFVICVSILMGILN